jgi:hypothetical protein
MVWMKRDCRLSTGLSPSSRLFSCEAGRRTCSKRETRTEELCEIKSAYTLLARSLVKHPLKGNEAAGFSHCQSGAWRCTHWRAVKPVIKTRQGNQCSDTTLTGESRFHISTPLGIEPRSLMTGSKQFPQDQWDMVWMKLDCRLSSPQ